MVVSLVIIFYINKTFLQFQIGGVVYYCPHLLGFFCVGLKRDLIKKFHRHNRRITLLAPFFGFFLTGLVFGILLSTSFTNEYKPFLDNVLYIIIVLSFIIPVYYSEFILGFILGMTYTFGAIIPTVFILIIAVIGLVAYRLIRPIILSLTTRLGNIFNKSPNR